MRSFWGLVGLVAIACGGDASDPTSDTGSSETSAAADAGSADGGDGDGDGDGTSGDGDGDGTSGDGDGDGTSGDGDGTSGDGDGTSGDGDGTSGDGDGDGTSGDGDGTSGDGDGTSGDGDGTSGDGDGTSGDGDETSGDGDGDGTSGDGDGTSGDGDGTSGDGDGDGTGVPFGLWGLNGYHSPAGMADVATRFNVNLVQVASADPNWTVNTFLPMARNAGYTVTLRMSGGHSVYTTGNDFDIDKWKARIDPWEGSGVEAFIADGTLVGHMILDDIANWSWPAGGVDPTGDELDEMARYSKEKLPGLMTFVRQRATEMPVPTTATYTYLDACVNQYRILEGDVTAYASQQRAAAIALDLGIINGLNLCDGGDGSSGQEGWRGPGFWAMSAAEIDTYGSALLVDGLGMFLSWEYDAEEIWPDTTIGADYLDQPAMQAALASLGTQVAQRPSVVLLKP